MLHVVVRSVCVCCWFSLCGVWCVACGLGRGGLGVGVIPCPRSARRTPGRVASGVRPGHGIVALVSQLVGTLLSASCPGATADSARSSSAMRAM